MSYTNNVNRVKESDYSNMIREQRVPQPVIKIKRTYGWLCPFDLTHPPDWDNKNSVATFSAVTTILFLIIKSITVSSNHRTCQ
jgi:hypothetical protein